MKRNISLNIPLHPAMAKTCAMLSAALAKKLLLRLHPMQFKKRAATNRGGKPSSAVRKPKKAVTKPRLARSACSRAPHAAWRTKGQSSQTQDYTSVAWDSGTHMMCSNCTSLVPWSLVDHRCPVCRNIFHDNSDAETEEMNDIE